ncbi:Thiamine-monophosphate kinase [Hartmannibacter diazotrophicus]|uniref:Thiamine-monophosphate kinase n=1 Tax=Hartmannibacter diazotrophicus TaxID=1482074 RepID=A0A2C9D7H2_9HYPH|nr:thiamine-phosphate kinase [Hartmannibacter diazotrophicus]SON56130.1 Thiamine-monophosphate kinase [Hartmannibacter diazotrophicus]
MSEQGATGARASETELIARYFAPLATEPSTFQLGDDAAYLRPRAGCDLVVTKDMLVAGVHFFPDDPPGAIAKKALRVNLSDLAAKGARPLGYLIGLGLTGDWTEAWLQAFSNGLAQDQETYGITLLGGDTVSSPERLTLSITAFGTVPEGRMVRRGGARAGDLICVTGTIGDAALGLQLRLDAGLTTAVRLTGDQAAFLKNRYLLPQPRCRLASVLGQHASAGMDISDGLVGDLAKMAAVSHVRIDIDIDKVPLSDAAKAACAARPDLLRTALTGGDDYELAIACAPASLSSFVEAGKKAGVAVSVIGSASEGSGLGLAGARGDLADWADRGSFSHF